MTIVNRPAASASRGRGLDLNLAGQTVLVTGASSGIGRGTALTLAACGADVVLLARNEGALAAVASEILTTSKTKVRIVVADVTDIQKQL